MKQKLTAFILAMIMLFGGIGHFLAGDFYSPMIPDWISVELANLLSGVAELGIGVLLLFPATRHYGGLAFAALMLAFLPIHAWDMLKDEPAIGNHIVAIIRFLFQFFLIWTGWWVFKGGPGKPPVVKEKSPAS